MVRSVVCYLLIGILLILSGLQLSSAIAQQRTSGLKIYISVDMEGIAGVVTGDQLGPSGFEYQRFRRFMTNETLAAVMAARESGAGEILISDSHGNGENLLIEEFPEDIRVIRSWPRHLGMMAGIDETFDAAIFIGYHASTTNLRGTRAHTFSSGRLTRVTLNGNPVSETIWNAAIAGHFGVPVIMVSGDDALWEEIKPVLPQVEFAETQKTLSFHSAVCLTNEASCKLIARAVKKAISRLSDMKPYKIAYPVTVTMSFKNYRPVQLLAYLPIFKRIDSHTIQFTGKNMVEVSDIQEFITSYSFTIEP